MAAMEDERKEHEAKVKKMEAEMEQVFETKVKEKRQKLKDSELDVSSSSNFFLTHLCTPTCTAKENVPDLE